MSAPTLLGLPVVPAELKSISPYLQRADELQQKEPIVAYWCAYYAAQVGISLKAKTAPARNLLLELLGALETMKQKLGPNDAVDSEAASAAYVENFALKVFSAADDEERSGKATRSTAKKFVAAANFLEVLKVFPKTEFSESNEEKIRYAKWKAADIAKAFREGRLPAPLPVTTGSESSADSPAPQQSPTQFKRHSPPPPIPLDQEHSIPHTPQGTHIQASSLNRGESTPGSWSTVATPGTGMGSGTLFGSVTPSDPESPLAGRGRFREEIASGRQRSRSRSGSSDKESPERIVPRPRRSSLKGNGNANAIALGLGSDAKKTVHFTPSTGGLTSTDDASEALSTPGTETSFQFSYAPPASSTSTFSPINQTGAPTSGLVPTVPVVPPVLGASQYSPPQSQIAPTASYVSPPPTQKVTPVPPTFPSAMAPYPPAPASSRSSPPSVTSYASPPNGYSPPSQISPQAEVPLTPAIIAKAQKHCRFAISSLDYEDAEQARKELWSALAVLGGL